MNHPWRLAAVFGLLFLVLPLGACGRKTPPVPPQEVEPAQISDLRYHLDVHGATLLWTTPSETGAGRKLAVTVSGFEIFGAEIPEERFCPGCPIPFQRLARYDGETPRPGETVRFPVQTLQPGHRYFYRVVPRYGWFRRGQSSNTVSFSWVQLPGPPAGLAISSGDRLLTLSWNPPLELDNNGIDFPLRYQVYRRQSGENFRPLGQPVNETTLTDKAVQPGQTYHYQVHAERLVHDTVLAGPVSETAAGTPGKIAPAAPRFLTAMKRPEGVLLVWQSTPAPGLAGHRIYRRDAISPQNELLGQILEPASRFMDESAPAGKPLFYTLTAIDRADPPNESPPSPVVEIIP